jgi:hypothetical protein
MFKTKPDNAINASIKNVFYLLQLDKKKSTQIIMGSNAYSNFLFSLDYDLFEVVKTEKDFDKLKSYFVKMIKKMFNEIAKDKTIYFNEFMCGIDKNNEPLLWTPQQIKTGINGEYKLIDVLNNKSVIKIEIIKFNNDNLFYPISNVYEIRNNEEHINREKETRDDIDLLKKDVLKFYEKRNYFKILKRMYLILKQQKKNIIVKNIEDYFNSNIGGLYQIKGLLETINDVLNIKSNKDTILKCQNAIDILKDKSAKLNYKFHENYYSYFDKARSKAGGKSMIKAINKLIDYINKIVQNHTRQFIKDNHINFKKFISK